MNKTDQIEANYINRGETEMKTEWEGLQKLGEKEMEGFEVGTKVILRGVWYGNKRITGIIVDTQEPIGLLAPRYKCKWDDGDESGWLLKSALTKFESGNL